MDRIFDGVRTSNTSSSAGKYMICVPHAQAKLTQGDAVWRKSPIDEQHPGGCWNIPGCWRSSPSESTWLRSSNACGIGQINTESMQKVSDVRRDERQAAANKYLCLFCCHIPIHRGLCEFWWLVAIEILVLLAISHFLLMISLHWDGAKHLFPFTVSRARHVCFCSL